MRGRERERRREGGRGKNVHQLEKDIISLLIKQKFTSILCP
jgi:hypothetical protein